MITITEAKTKRELKDFVKFPFKIYKDNAYWVPPLISQELKTFDKKENPVFDDADAYFFVAKKNGDIVGRVTAIINWIEVNDQKIKKMRFGWFDVIDDIEVTKALLNKIEAIGREHNLEFIEGPIGFSNLDKVGILTEGFDEMGTMITWYNHPYYAEHFKQLGFDVEKKYLESKFYYENINPKNFSRAQELVKKRYKLKPVNFTSNKEVLPYAEEIFNLFEASHAQLSTFVHITARQKEYFKKKFISFINPEYIKIILDENDKMVAFAIVTPSFAKALQKANGKLFPFGFRHILRAKKHSKKVTFYLIGVHPDYKNKGLTAIIFNEFYKVFNEKGIKEFIRGPELEDNTAIQQIWKHFDPVTHKKRCTFRKEIA